MKVSIVCTDFSHPVMTHLENWKKQNSSNHQITIVKSKAELNGGDLLFLVSCSEIIGAGVRNMFKHTLVLHASDLPAGRGWSPHIWTILKGGNELTLSLLEAAEPVDSGKIWRKVKIQLDGSELYDEINQKLFENEIALIDWAVANVELVKPQEQSSLGISHYPKRTPENSRLDIDKTIREQFNSLRVADPNRFPAFFEHLGVQYEISIKKKP